MPEEKKEKGLIESFFDLADGIVDTVDRAIVPRDNRLWEVTEIDDNGETSFTITNGGEKVIAYDKKLAERICAYLND